MTASTLFRTPWPFLSSQSTVHRESGSKTPALQKERLLAYDEDGEAAGLHFAAALARGWRVELSAGEENLVRFQIEAQGASGIFLGNVFHDCVFGGRILVGP